LVKLGGATSFSTNNSNLTFASTLNSDSTGAKALTISTGTGTIAFDAAVGNLYAIGTTTITGGILNAASTLYFAGTTSSISTAGAQTYTGAVTLGASTRSTFQTTANNNITFSSTLNGDALSRAVTVSAGSGTVAFNGAVGNLYALGVTTVTAGTLTFADDFYSKGNTVLTATTLSTASGKAFSVISSANLTMTADSLAIGAALTGSPAGTLTIQPRTNSTTVGIGSSAAGSLAISDTELGYINGKFGNLILGSSTGTALVTVKYTASTFTYSQPLTLRSNTGGITTTTTYALNTGAYSLTITGGSLTLGQILSGTLAVTGSSINLSLPVTTTGDTGSQTYNGPVVLSEYVNMDSRGVSGTGVGANISFSSTVNSVGTYHPLVIYSGAGSVTFGGAVGNILALSSFSARSTHATGITLTGNVTTRGNQDYFGNVLLNADTSISTTNNGYVNITGTVSSGLIASNVGVSFYQSADLAGGASSIGDGNYFSSGSAGVAASFLAALTLIGMLLLIRGNRRSSIDK
jgi:hypothetical protein